jgi:hypothetical protein
MRRSFLSQLLCVLLALPVPANLQARNFNQEHQPTLQEQLVSIPAGSIIEVKTKSKTRITGKLGALTSESLEVQVAKGQTVEKQSIRFDEVKSIKNKSQHMVWTKKDWIIVSAGVGIVIVLLVLGYQATHN